MSRPATGSPVWISKTSTWGARITAPGMSRKPIPLVDANGKPTVPACLVAPAAPPARCSCASCALARRVVQSMSDRARNEGRVPESVGETCDEWYERYHEYQITIGRSDARTKRSRWTKWMSPRIGTKAPAAVTRGDIEDLRDALDASILAWDSEGRAEDRVSGKTAMNIWSVLVSSFKAMTSGKRRDLRVLEGKPNPCNGVEPPGDRDSRKARRKPFIYPKEAAALFACEAVSLAWREVHAVAAFTYLRPGELRVLTVGDVDIQARVILVNKAWHYVDEVDKAPKTRNGVRRVPIEEALVPLLARMIEGKAPTDLVVPLISSVPDNSLAEIFREHLTLAGIDRDELHRATRTHAHANFRSWRDSGLTWLAMSGLGVDKISRRAGHDTIQTTMGYVKLAEDLTGDLGVPFGALPTSLVDGGSAVALEPALDRGGDILARPEVDAGAEPDDDETGLAIAQDDERRARAASNLVDDVPLRAPALHPPGSQIVPPHPIQIVPAAGAHGGLVSVRLVKVDDARTVRHTETISPASTLVEAPEGFGFVSAFRPAAASDSAGFWRRARDSNPW